MKTDFTIADKKSPIAEAIEDKKSRQTKIEDERIASIQELNMSIVGQINTKNGR
jgi:hypothetical protein